jgi:hypothetical protein
MILAAAICAAALAAGVSAAAGPQNCPSASVGPGTQRHGGTTGAACLLTAFQNGCRRAEYVFTSFGVDTVAVENFSVERRSGRCAVVVLTSFQVIPQKAHLLPSHTCRRLHKTTAGIVADRCTPARTISLTKPPSS